MHIKMAVCAGRLATFFNRAVAARNGKWSLWPSLNRPELRPTNARRRSIQGLGLVRDMGELPESQPQLGRYVRVVEVHAQ